MKEEIPQRPAKVDSVSVAVMEIKNESIRQEGKDSL